MLPTCPTLALVGLASVCAAVTEVKKFCAIPKFRDTDVTPLIAVVCTAAAADSVSCSCPSSEVLPDTRTVPRKPALPAAVTVLRRLVAPPTLSVEFRLTAPAIVTVLAKLAAPPTLSVEASDAAPPTVPVPPKLVLPETDTSSSNSALPVVISVPPIEVLPAMSTVPETDTAS